MTLTNTHGTVRSLVPFAVQRTEGIPEVQVKQTSTVRRGKLAPRREDESLEAYEARLREGRLANAARMRAARAALKDRIETRALTMLADVRQATAADAFSPAPLRNGSLGVASNLTASCAVAQAILREKGLVRVTTLKTGKNKGETRVYGARKAGDILAELTTRYRAFSRPSNSYLRQWDDTRLAVALRNLEAYRAMSPSERSKASLHPVDAPARVPHTPAGDSAGYRATSTLSHHAREAADDKSLAPSVRAEIHSANVAARHHGQGELTVERRGKSEAIVPRPEVASWALGRADGVYSVYPRPVRPTR